MKIESVLQGVTEALAGAAGNIEAMKTEQKQIKTMIGELEQEFARIPSGGFAATAKRANPLAQEIVASDGLESVRSGLGSTGKITFNHGLRAALSNEGSGQADDSAYPTPAHRAGGIQGIAVPRLSILDLLASIKTTERTFEFVVLDGYANAAAVQLKEGDLKQETELPAKLSRSEIATIAHWLPASLQVLDDNAGLQNIIVQLLSVGCRQKLEREVLVGAGGDGQILGLVPQAQEFTSTAANSADRIGEAVTSLGAEGWNANAIVMNPTDWFAIASERAAGDGQYILGSPRDPSPASLWGIPVALSPSMTSGKAMVLDTSAANLLDREQVSVQLSRHDGDNFRRNMVTILAELRAGLAVYAPTATRLVTLV